MSRSGNARSIEHLGERIASGRTAQVHALDDGRVIKLFIETWHWHEIDYEFDAALNAHELGIPTPRPLEVVRYGSRTGIVFERVFGATLSAILKRQPWRARSLLRAAARLQRSIHNCEAGPLRDQMFYLRPMLERDDGPPAEQAESYLDDVAQFSGNKLCHYDFHPDNILCSESGLTVIDWNKAAQGHPDLDVAVTSVKIGRLLGLPSRLRGSFAGSILSRWLRRSYLHGYYGPDESKLRVIERLTPAVTAVLAR